MGDKVKPGGRKSKAGESRKSLSLSEVPTNLFGRSNKELGVIFGGALLVADAILICLIIAYVPYTKIDWDAYMSQVTGFLGGERDYSNLEGDTGPLVYPAGFLYVYSGIQYITGGSVLPAQVLFGIMYIINLAVILFIYIKTDAVRYFLLLNVSLLLIHLGLLAAFAHRKWCKHEGGLLKVLHTVYVSTLSCFPLQQLYAYGTTSKTLKEEHIVTAMFVGNFIGIVCARSLHYQFYSWYFFSLPYLLWKTPFPTLLRIALFATVECCWNVFPSNCYSSAILLFVHLLILWGLWIAPSEYPYLDDKPSSRKKII